MAITTKQHITRELARLRMWRDVASDEEIDVETPVAHGRINELLDQLDTETVKRLPLHVTNTQRSTDTTAL